VVAVGDVPLTVGGPTLLETVRLVEVVAGGVPQLSVGVPTLPETVRFTEVVAGGVVQLSFGVPMGDYVAGGCWRFHGMGVPMWYVVL
jgi:hypothetical protein